VQLSTIQTLANEAARDPSRAARLAGIIADGLRQIAEQGETAVPDGYLYAPAQTWIVLTNDLDPEPTPPDGGPALTTSGNPPVIFKVPFDALITGVAGWSIPVAQPIADETTITLAQQQAAAQLSNAKDCRDLFSMSMQLDGQTIFGTDGFSPLMFPASVVVGSRRRPRQMAWTLRRNQTIGIRFRNLTNVPLEGISEGTFGPVRLATAAVAFYALNLEAS
jgi:hypothetical protein